MAVQAMPRSTRGERTRRRQARARRFSPRTPARAWHGRGAASRPGASQGEQLALALGCLAVKVADAANDEPGAHRLAFPRGERGMGDLSDIDFAHPAGPLLVPDGPPVLDGPPGFLGNVRDRRADLRVQRCADSGGRRVQPLHRQAYPGLPAGLGSSPRSGPPATSDSGHQTMRGSSGAHATTALDRCSFDPGYESFSNSHRSWSRGTVRVDAPYSDANYAANLTKRVMHLDPWIRETRRLGASPRGLLFASAPCLCRRTRAVESIRIMRALAYRDHCHMFRGTAQ